jgi:hypothetical protein
MREALRGVAACGVRDFTPPWFHPVGSPGALQRWTRLAVQLR